MVVGVLLTFIPATSMRVLTWKWAPTWITLGTQYSSMLLNCGDKQECELLQDRAAGFPRELSTTDPIVPLFILTGYHRYDKKRVVKSLVYLGWSLRVSLSVDTAVP